MVPAAAPVQTAFVVAVPEAEALVHELRLRHDHAARLGVAAHLTLLYPFMPPQQITPEVLMQAAAAYPPLGGMHPTIVPHLTVGQGGADVMEPLAAELQAALRAHGPVDACCRQVTLLQTDGGRWRETHRLALPTQGVPFR